MSTSERRVTRAIDEAVDVVDDAGALERFIDGALVDGCFSLPEAHDARRRVRRLRHQALESVVAVEWTDAGERLAVSNLAGVGSARAVRFDREVRQRAHALGMRLSEARGVAIEFPAVDGDPRTA